MDADTASRLEQMRLDSRPAPTRSMSSKYNSNHSTSTADIRLKWRKMSPLMLDTFSVRPYVHVLMKILVVKKAHVNYRSLFFLFCLLSNNYVKRTSEDVQPHRID